MTNFFKSLEQKKDVPVAGTKLVKVPQKIKVTHSQKIPNSKHQLVGIGQDSGALWQSKTPFSPQMGVKMMKGMKKSRMDQTLSTCWTITVRPLISWMRLAEESSGITDLMINR